MQLEKIYKVQYMSTVWTYGGTLRNEFDFNIGDIVYFSINKHDIFKGKIFAKELPLGQNEDTLYKVTIPEDIIRKELQFDYDKLRDKDVLHNTVIKCDSIFKTLDDAKKSALDRLDHLYNLQLKEIEDYFNKLQ